MAEARTIVVSVRLDPESVHALDLLVGSGIARSRSEATARLVQIGLSASAKLLEAAREIAGRAHRLRQEFGSGTAFPPLRPPRTERDAGPSMDIGTESAANADGTSGAVTRDAKDDEALLRLYQEAVERSRAEEKAGGDLDVFRAATRPEPGAIQAMIEKSPQLVHQHDENGWTPLHLAAYNGDHVMVEKLLASGADPGIPSLSGETPLDVAVMQGHKAVAQLLARSVRPLSRKNVPAAQQKMRRR